MPAEITSFAFKLQENNYKGHAMSNTISVVDKTSIISSISSFIAEMFPEIQDIIPDFKKQQETAPIVMISVYEDTAFAYQQDINVLDSNGSYYSFQIFEEEKKIDLDEDGWYEKILGIDPKEKIEYGKYYTQVKRETMKTIIDFTGHLENYKDCAMRNYSDVFETDDDVGVFSVYGIYYSKDGIPQYLKSCRYGEWIECLDNKYVIDFVNKISSVYEMRHIFYGDMIVKFPY